MKKDELYAELLGRRVVTTDEILEAAEGIVSNPSKDYLLKKYVRKYLNEGKMIRIRRGLYAVLDPSQEPSSFTPDRFLVGSKVKDGGFLGFHTALEFHGFANSAFYNTVYVCVESSKRFDKFLSSGIWFKAVSPKDMDAGIVEEEHLGQPVRVTSRERTLVDCLDRVSYAGGWGECLKSLESIRGLDFERLTDYALSRENDFLVRKVGFVLDLLKDSSAFYEDLTEDHLEKLFKSIGESPRYLEGAKRMEEKPSRNGKWNLYVHPGFEERFLRGI